VIYVLRSSLETSMFRTLEAKYKRENFEATVVFDCNLNSFKVQGIDFVDCSTPEDFEHCSRMMMDVADILRRLRGEDSAGSIT